MKPEYIDLPSYVSGDLWLGIALIGPVLVDGQPPALALAKVEMIFKRASSDVSATFLLTSETPLIPNQGPMVITSPSLWTVNVPPQVLALAPRTWKWSMVFTDADGNRYTYLAGTLPVCRL